MVDISTLEAQEQAQHLTQQHQQHSWDRVYHLHRHRILARGCLWSCCACRPHSIHLRVLVSTHLHPLRHTCHVVGYQGSHTSDHQCVLA